MSPASRSSPGRRTWLRLRSTRNSGGPRSRGRPDDGLDLIGLHSELGTDRMRAFPSPEGVQDVLDPHLLPLQDRLAKGESGVDDDVRTLVGLQPQAGGV